MIITHVAHFESPFTVLRIFEGEVGGDTFLQNLEITKERLEKVKPSKISDTINFYHGSNMVTKNSYEYRRKDHVSHFLLRLYCCRNEELKKWLIWHETKFLRFQLLDENNLKDINTFMKKNNMNYEEVTEPTKCNSLLCNEKLLWDTRFAKQSKSMLRIFKVPFEEALEMVRLRRVYLERGFAYILSLDMVSLICSKFRMELSHALASMSRRLPILDEDDRLIPRVNSVYHDLVTKVDQMKKADEKSANRERITPDMINRLAEESFPPCMRSIHNQLRKNHHLKHYGRLHYSLFLKSIGLTLQDALQFFREEFIQSVGPEKFAKEYSYNIRYNYGQEGKKTSLSAYGCKKIINDNPPGSGDAHGCPFKHFDKEHLESMLKRYGTDGGALTEMMDLVEKKEYNGACTKFFKCKHPNYILRAEGQEIYHPNQFYSESRRAHLGIVNEPFEQGPGEENENRKDEDNGQQFDVGEDFFDDPFDMELKEVTDAQLLDFGEIEVGKEDERSEERVKNVEEIDTMDVQEAPNV